MTTPQEVRDKFVQRVLGVIALLEFDDLVLEHLVGGLDELVADLETKNLHSAATIVSNRLTALKNVRARQSLRPTYGTIYNQCVVLLVSYFDATMSDLFKVATAAALRAGLVVPAAERTVQLSWQSLSAPAERVEALIAERIVDEDDISFQDMQSIRRAFLKNLKIDLGRDQRTNDVILGQAARHVMAHSGGRIDDRFLNQISGAHPRSLKPTPPSEGLIQFEPNEIRALADAMQAFVDGAVAKIRATTDTAG